MDDTRYLKIWFRWSLVLSTLVALGWGIYALTGQEVPVIFGISRWWDIATPGILIGSIVWPIYFSEKWKWFRTSSESWFAINVTVGCLFGIIGSVAFGVPAAIIFPIIGHVLFFICFAVSRIPISRERNFGDWLMCRYD
ncbi:MAG TPA: hypothetical protein VJI33_01270 [Candidatus Paceibacterota bacterium]